MKSLHYLTFTLLAVGGLNWGLVVFDYNLVDSIFGAGSTISTVIYALVGISALYEIFVHSKNCKTCSSKKRKKDGSSAMDMDM